MTAAQLQILQLPITSLILTISTSVIVKLNDTNYLTWNFQMQLLLKGHGLMGFVDGSSLCHPRLPTHTSSNLEVHSCNSSSSKENDEFKVWKMHDHALMQLLTATLSSPAVSCVIRSISACDMWTRLNE